MFYNFHYPLLRHYNPLSCASSFSSLLFSLISSRFSVFLCHASLSLLSRFPFHTLLLLLHIFLLSISTFDKCLYWKISFWVSTIQQSLGSKFSKVQSSLDSKLPL
uniref:Uncharacterized protein n=1 Tax=Cacopsylla melanoneura TaxID=428564 RepID=A0A8D8M634_9HEMI